MTTSLKGLVNKSELPNLLENLGIKKQVSQPKNREVKMHAYARMMADPLNAPVVGRPDDNAYATNAVRLKDVYDVTADAQGNWAMAVCGSPASSSSVATITAGAITGWGAATDSSWYASLNTDNAVYRPLIYVVEWKPSMSGTNSSGSVFMANYPGTSVTGNIPVQAVAQYFDDPGASGRAGEYMVFVGRYVSPAPFGTLSSVNCVSFPPVLAVLTGLPPSLLAGKITITRIYELVPKGGTMPSLTASHTVCDVNSCCAAANIVGSTVTAATGSTGYQEVVKAGLAILKEFGKNYLNGMTGGVSDMIISAF